LSRLKIINDHLLNKDFLGILPGQTDGTQ